MPAHPGTRPARSSLRFHLQIYCLPPGKKTFFTGLIRVKQQPEMQGGEDLLNFRHN